MTNNLMEIDEINLKSIRRNKDKLKNEIIETPVSRLNSSYLNKLFPNTDILMKLELFQHTGLSKLECFICC